MKADLLLTQWERLMTGMFKFSFQSKQPAVKDLLTIYNLLMPVAVSQVKSEAGKNFFVVRSGQGKEI
jgi:hypothetical protein